MKLRKSSKQVILFFYKIILTSLGPLRFHMNVRISMLISAEMPTLIVMGIVLNLWYYRLNNINLSNSWTWGISPLFLCFLYFNNTLQISVKSWTLCVKFVSSYFICFHIIVSGIFGLTSFLDYLLLVFLFLYVAIVSCNLAEII